ncbi:Conjugative transposon protein TraO [Paenimyroides ummariense]|uniref:Conjugative transposon protein TraO n=2 Tax=Paenimyroides ummariense TaxID=913024 RepID=A0A1I5GUN0_9FLAO|nr:Conjugative transposon protein TraO [Paenimyroides ummariense]
MKQFIYTVLMVLLNITLATAQRMLPKQKGLEITAGLLSHYQKATDYHISAAMTVNSKKGNYQLWGFEYSKKQRAYKSTSIPQETYTIEGGYSFFLLSDAQKNIVLNFGLTGIVGYESLNRGETMLYDGAKMMTEDNFIYGAGGRLTLETYLSDWMVLLIQARTKVYWNTDVEQFRPSLGLGLRFNF